MPQVNEFGLTNKHNFVMSHTSKRFITLAFGLCLILISGCGPKVKSLYCDPSFTPEAVAGGKFIIGGMTTVIGNKEDHPAMRAELDSLFWIRLTAELKGIDLAPPGYIKTRLYEEVHKGMLESYEISGELNKKDQPVLRTAFKDSLNYVIFGRLEENRVLIERTTLPGSPGESQIINIATRRVTVSFHIYNTRTGHPVWSAKITAWKSTGKEEPEEEGFFEGILSDVLFGEEPIYPDPPPLESVVRKVFRGFAKKLPVSK